MNKKKILSGVGVFAAILVMYFLYEYIRYVSTDNAQVEAHSVLLSAKVGGYINKVNVSEGQSVKKGDILIEIDERDFQNNLKQIESELTSIEARKRDAERTFNRVSALFKQGAVSQQQFDTSNTTYSEVKAKYEAIAAQLAQAQLNLDNTKIRAPSNGFIAKKSAEVAQLASPGIPLVGFVDAEERWVTANFKETEISNIKIGAKVDVSVDAINHSFDGEVAAISSATGATFTLLPPDNATGNFTKVVQRVPVKITIKNISETDIEKLRAGLSATVKVHKF